MAQRAFPPPSRQAWSSLYGTPGEKAREATKGFSGPKKGPMSVVLLLHCTT
jgi:hypothetical protein